jgi:hypothetical protein
MIASRSIAHGLYQFCLSHDLLQKRRNFSADHARDMVSRNFGPVLFARGIAVSTCDDLTPFLADGTVTANLPRFLENTAKIEIGPWTARAGLISAAILLCVPCGKTPPPRAFSSEVDTGSHQENAIKQRARCFQIPRNRKQGD